MNNIDWKKALVFLIVIGGLIYITKAELRMTTTNSFLTTECVLVDKPEPAPAAPAAAPGMGGMM